MGTNGSTDWHISGEEVVSCNCAWGCPCQFNANPTNGHCRGVGVWEIAEGHFGDTNLDGVRWGALISWPGPIHEGNGTIQIVFDGGSTDEQRAALGELASGQHGGAFFEIFAAVCPNVMDPVAVPIEFESDRDRRVARIKLGEIAETRVEPIRNPVDNSEHRARIDLPGGFEYKQAEVGNTVEGRSSLEEPLKLELENTYAQLNAFDWSPA
jgi:hypothetical protein